LRSLVVLGISAAGRHARYKIRSFK
jgi:hypothetical protein